MRNLCDSGVERGMQRRSEFIAAVELEGGQL